MRAMKYPKRLLGLGCALLFAALAPGCGGGSSAGAVSLSDLPGQLADAWCDNIGSCCSAAAIAFDLATCKTNVASSFSLQLAQESSPNIKYDSAAASRCVATYTSVFKTCKDDRSLDDACKAIFVGTLPAGAPCTTSGECAPPAAGSTYCNGGDSVGMSTQGVCAVMASQDGKLGEACGNTCQTQDDCVTAPAETGTGTASVAPKTCFIEDGLQCDSVAQTCQPLIAIGEPCISFSCVMGAFCSSSGACTPAEPDGTSCNGDIDCLSGSCVFGADSDLSIGTCGLPLLANQKSCSGGA